MFWIFSALAILVVTLVKFGIAVALLSLLLPVLKVLLIIITLQFVLLIGLYIWRNYRGR